MKTVGKILKLFISQKDSDGITQSLPQTTISLDKDGVKNDKFHALDSQRAILLSSYESYRIAQDNNFLMNYGALGENILMDFNPYDLKDGDQIQIGEVLLQITQHCTLCKGLSKVNPKAPKLLKKHRGIFAKTVTSGNINLGDTVSL